MEKQSIDYIRYIDALNKIGIALSAEKDYDTLLEKILISAMSLTHADGGTLYLLKENQLRFTILINDSLKMKLKKISDEETISFKHIDLFDSSGNSNLKNIASSCYFQNKTIKIDDAYRAEEFDFSGTRSADQASGYHSTSFLTVPLRNHESNIIGVLQLINAIDKKTKTIIPFSEDSIHLAESLASQAAITLTQRELIAAQKKLFESFIQLIAKAIDEKSAYTSNHCSHVPILTSMIAEAVNLAQSGPFEKIHFTKDQVEELRIAAWLHDCGKVTTPEYVMDKATKLQTLCDRIDVINLRFEILRRDLKISYLEKLTKTAQSKQASLRIDYQKEINALTEAQQFLQNVNIGGEFLSEENKAKIRDLSEIYHFIDTNNVKTPLLNALETENLSISRGTLNDHEREMIQNHVRVTQKMLDSLPYPDYLKHVPEIAGSHHERMDGRGYPRGLHGDQMLLQARIVAIADIFEALTAADRPYKPAKTLKEALTLMAKMKNDHHIDPHLFDLFIREKIYLRYAEKYLDPKQIEGFDEKELPL